MTAVRPSRAILGLPLFLGLVLAMALVLGLAAPPRDVSAAVAGVPSSLNPDPQGLAAAARWLEATGRPAGRRPGAGDVARPAVVLLAGPRAPLDDAQVGGLLDEVARGGLLVWAMGERPQPALARRLGVRRLPGTGERTVAGHPDHPLLAGLLLETGQAAVEATGPGAWVAAGPGDRPAALGRRAGLGEVLILAGTEPLDNARIGRLDALSLWVRLSARGPLVFDERWVAPAGPGGGSPGAPLLLALQALVVAALLLAALAPRFGPVRPPGSAAARQTTRDYLASLAALYRRAGAGDALAADAWRRLRRRLEREAGLPVRLGGEAAAAQLARRSPEAAEALRRGEAALAGPGEPTPPASGRGQARLLEVSRAAAEVSAALAHARRRRL